MSQYRNQSASPVVLQGKNGLLMTIAPGQIVELDFNVARRGMPYLVAVAEQYVPGPQMLIESPLPVAEAPSAETFETTVAEAEQPKKRKRK